MSSQLSPQDADQEKSHVGSGSEQHHALDRQHSGQTAAGHNAAGAAGGWDAENFLGGLDLEDLSETAQHYWRSATTQASEAVRKYPMQTLGVVLGVGVLAGMLLGQNRK